MEYMIIESCVSVAELEEDVRKAINDGWEPIGGVAITDSESDDYRYFQAAQAMVRKAN